MTGSRREEGPPGSRLAEHSRSVWASPFLVHVVALAAVLLVTFVVTRPGFAYSVDEGVVAYQVDLLVDEGRWQHAYPFDDIDPSGEARPFPRGAVSGDRVVPYAKHPLYPVLLAPANWLGGVAAMVLISTLGTLVAAGLTARVAAAINAALARPALWITGVASPLFFDAFFLLAHSLAAAAVAAAGLACARLLAGTERRLGWSVCLAGSVGLAVALRSEAVLVGAGLAIGALVVWWLRRGRRPGAVLILTASVAGTAVAWVLERFAYRVIVGGSQPVPRATGVAVDFWDARFTSVGITWFEGTSGRMTATSIALTATIVVLGASVIAHRLGRLPGTLAVTVLVVATLVYSAHLVVAPAATIPGLMVAFPLLWVGLLLLDQRTFATDTALLLGVAGGVVVVAVVLTQYPQGGGAEWGGRFFAVGLPLLIPVVLDGFRLEAQRLPARSRLRRAAVPVAVVSTVVIAMIAVNALRVAHDRAADLEAAVAASAEEAGLATAAGRPVVVTTERLLPQLLFPTLTELEWVVPPGGELGAYVERLGSTGVERFVLATREPDRDLAALRVDRSDLDGERTRAGYLVMVVDLQG